MSELRRLAAQGLALGQLADQLQVSDNTMGRWLADAGITLPRASLKNRPRGASTALARPARADLLRLYVTEGRSLVDIAAATGATVHLVRIWLHEYTIAIRAGGARPGVPRQLPIRKPAPPPEQLRELYLTRRLGRERLAVRYHVHPQTVSRWLRAAGLPSRLPPPAALLSDQQMITLYGQHGLSAAQIARRAGVAASRVLRVLHDAGIRIDPERQKQAARAAVARRADVPALPPSVGNWAQAQYVQHGWSYARIADALGVPMTRVHRELDHRGVASRRHSMPNRGARAEAPLQAVEQLYVQSEWSAEDVGATVQLPGPVVLRTGHAYGFPIRQGGRPLVSATVQLIEGLYADEQIAAVLATHRVPYRAPGGGIAQRFPDPIPLTPALLRDLYIGVGCSSPHIELLTGQAQTTVRARMHEWGITVRAGHTQPPALRRLRAAARADFLTDVAAAYRQLGSTAAVAEQYGCNGNSVRRWLAHAGVAIPGRGQWPRTHRDKPHHPTTRTS